MPYPPPPFHQKWIFCSYFFTLPLYMTGELWTSLFFWHQDIRVTYFQSSALSFVLTHSQLLNIMILKFNCPVLLDLLGNIFPYCPAVGAVQKINSSSIDLPGRSVLRPPDFPRAQAIFHCISLLSSNYRYNTLSGTHSDKATYIQRDKEFRKKMKVKKGKNSFRQKTGKRQVLLLFYKNSWYLFTDSQIQIPPFLDIFQNSCFQIF